MATAVKEKNRGSETALVLCTAHPSQNNGAIYPSLPVLLLLQGWLTTVLRKILVGTNIPYS
jgi:hypothetical protein